MIETFKTINGIYDKDVTERFFEMSRTGQTSQIWPNQSLK
jgi:hypothetical protein